MRADTGDEGQPAVSRAEYDDHGGARQNRPGPLTLDDYDRVDEGLALKGLRASARRRHRADELTSPRRKGNRNGWRWRISAERGSGTVEFVAMAVGAIVVLTIVGGVAYRALGCDRAGEQQCVAQFMTRHLGLP